MQWLHDLMKDLQSALNPAHSQESLELQEWLMKRAETEVEASTSVPELHLSIHTQAHIEDGWKYAVLSGTQEALAKADIKTLRVLKEAAENYDGFIVYLYTMNGEMKYEKLIRSAVVLYEAMAQQGLHFNMHANAVLNLRSQHPAFMVADFSEATPEKLAHARAAISFIAYDMRDIGSLSSKSGRDLLAEQRARKIPKEIVDLFAENPELAQKVIDFAHRRNVKLDEIDPEVLSIALATESETLNGGVL